MASLRELAEGALKKYLDASNIGATVYLGQDSEDKAMPHVIVRAVSAEANPPHAGNYNLDVQIIIKAAAGDSTFNTLCENVRYYLDMEWEDLGVQLSQAEPNLTVWGASAAYRYEWDTSNDAWTETHTVQLYCSPQSFS